MARLARVRDDHGFGLKAVGDQCAEVVTRAVESDVDGGPGGAKDARYRIAAEFVAVAEPK